MAVATVKAFVCEVMGGSGLARIMLAISVREQEQLLLFFKQDRYQARFPNLCLPC